MLKQVANNIRSIRKATGLSQEEMASRLGISRQSYNTIEAGGDTSLSRFLTIAKALDIEPYYLLMTDESFSLVGKNAHIKTQLNNVIQELIAILSSMT